MRILAYRLRNPSVLVLFALIFYVPSLTAADQWIKVTTAHFQLYTTAGEKKGREAILYFEQVRSFFAESSGSKKQSDFPVRIVAFKSEKQYAPYRLNEVAAAFYTRDETRDYIVMQDIVSEHYPIAIHEYTHLVIEHSGLKLPVWMNEGWAELYSTLRPNGKKTMIGELIPGRLVTLMQSKPIPLAELGRIDHDSPMYNERDKAGLFYAESWAFVHMLYLSPDYRPKFSKFVKAIAHGSTLDTACKEALDKPIWDVQKDFDAYFHSNKLYAAVFDVKLNKSEEDPEVSEVGDFESGLVLADLLTVTRKLDRAEAAYTKLAQMKPGSPEVEESLGYLYFNKNDRPSSRIHFTSALKNGSISPLMCYRLGLLDREVSDDASAMHAFSRAIELKPDYVDARLMLGQEYLQKREYQKSVDVLTAAKRVSEEQAPWLFSSLAFDYMELNKDEDARKNAEAAKKWAKNPGESRQAENVIAVLDQRQQMREHPQREAARSLAPEPDSARESLMNGPRADSITIPHENRLHVEGKAKKLVCAGASAALTIVDADGKLKTFTIPDPQKIVIKHANSITFDFNCGPQNGYKIAIDYVKPKAEGEADGVVRLLEF